MDLGKIGYKIEIDDKKYTAILKKMEKNAEGSANTIGNTFRKALAFLGGALLFREGLNGARMFSDELANISTIANVNTRKLRKEITNLSSSLGSSAELANAMFFAFSSGVSGTEKEMAEFTGRIAALAKATNSEMMPIMDAVTTLMAAYNLKTEDAGMLTDWFFTIVKNGKAEGGELAQSLGRVVSTAANAGITLDELGAAISTLSTTMPASVAITSLASSLQSFMNPTAEAKQAAAALGIELSLTSLKAKGLGGMMEEIYQKTQGRADLIAKMFPMESSRAVMALAGTQIGTLKQNLVDFGDKGGAAAAGFGEKLKSLDERIKALQITGQKILTVFADTVVQVVTLGGVLNPLLDKFMNLKEEGIAFTARLLAIVAGVLLLKKAQNALNLRAQAIEMAGVTAATAAQTAATDQETAAIMRNTAAIQANKAARSVPALDRVDLNHQINTARGATYSNINQAKGAKSKLDEAKQQYAEAQKWEKEARDRVRIFGEEYDQEYAKWMQTGSGEFKYSGSGLTAANADLKAATENTAALRREVDRLSLSYRAQLQAARQSANEAAALSKRARTPSAASYAGLDNDSFRRQNIQMRWDERRIRREARIAYASEGNDRFGRAITTSRTFNSFNVAASSATPQVEKLTSAFSSLKGVARKAGGTLSEFGKDLLRLADNGAVSAMSLRSWGNGVKSIGRGATGMFATIGAGLKGVAGKFLGVLTGPIGIIGMLLITVVDAFKDQISNTVMNAWYGVDIGEWEKENQRQIEERDERIRKQEEEAQKAAAAAEKKAVEDKEAKERRERRYQASRDYQFGRADTGTQVSMLNADLLNLQNKAVNAKTDEERTKAQEEYWQTLAKLDETKNKLEEELKTRQELAREAELAQYRAQLAGDGEISKADELLLKQREIEQQEQRIADAVERTEKARAKYNLDPANQTNADKYRQSLRDEATTRSQYYEMKNHQRQDKIDYANQERSLQRQLRMNKLITELKQDGEYSFSDQLEVQKQKVKDIVEELEAAKAVFDQLTGDKKKEIKLKISQLDLERATEQMNLKRMEESGLKSQGSFSAELLNLMSGAQAPQQETAENTRKTLQETKKLNENVKSSKLVYGSR